MPPTVLPDLLYRGSAIFVFALGVGLTAVHTGLVARAAPPPSIRGGNRLPLAWAVGAFLTVWLGLAITVADSANFPLDWEDGRLLVSALVGFGPMLVAIALLFASSSMRRVNAAMPPAWLIWVQTYRVAGLIFLYPFAYYGILPWGFAVPAGVGDFLVGALAPFVGLAVARRHPHAFAFATAWNLFGILDLIVAPTAAVLSQAQVIGLYPVSLVPLFIGPPLGILTHVYSLRNLAVAARRPATGVERGGPLRGEALRTI
jgi:hypothetical protein